MMYAIHKRLGMFDFLCDFLISPNVMKQTVVDMPQQKNISVSMMCHVTSSINYSLRTMPHAVHKLTYCLLWHSVPLFLKCGPQDIDVLGCKVTSLSRTPEVFNGIQVATPFEVPKSPAAIP